ncbi:unnamed protein product [Alopecurus aequalis]
MAVKRRADAPVSSRPGKMMRTIVRPHSRSLPPCLPDAMIFSILSRLPSKSIIQCKLVCKAWRAMLSDRHFVDEHLGLSKAHPAMLVLPRAYFREREGLLSFSLDFYDFGHGGKVRERVYRQDIPNGIGPCTQPLHCDGLILISTLNQEIMVCNPAIKEFVALPKGSQNLNESHRVGFGFDPSSNKYKVARLFYQLEEDGTSAEPICRFEVLMLCTDDEWRQTVDDPPYPIMGKTPAHVRGALYWMIDLPSAEHPNAFIRFDLADEKFSITPCPLCERTEPTCFVQSEEELCCACFTKQCLVEIGDVVEIWMICSKMGEAPPVWTLRCTIPLPQDSIVPYPTGGSKLPSVMFREKDLLLVCDYKVYEFCVGTGEIKEVAGAFRNLQYYDRLKKKYQTYMYMGKDVDFYTITNYAESLVQIRGSA